jgi:hypothetical protein
MRLRKENTEVVLIMAKRSVIRSVAELPPVLVVWLELKDSLTLAIDYPTFRHLPIKTNS